MALFLAVLLTVVSVAGVAQAEVGPPIPPGIDNPTFAAPAFQPMLELSWTAGDPFPVVDGKTIFPSVAVPVSGGTSPPPAYATHWYAGSVYSGSAHTATWMFTQIKTPKKLPKADEFYYVLLSAWDNAGSYNQIGFADAYGVWGLTYSWTSGPCTDPTYHYSANAMALSLSTVYKFYINTESGGTWFEAFVGSTMVWWLWAATGGTALTVDDFYCGSYDYTDYIEVWQTHDPGGYPKFTFKFKFNQWWDGVWHETSWIAFEVGPVPAITTVTITGQKVVIYK